MTTCGRSASPRFAASRSPPRATRHEAARGRDTRSRYPRETISRLLGQGRLFEYWAHEQCLVPVEEWPLFRSRMTRHHPWRGDAAAEHPELAAEILAALRERGPLASRDFEGTGGGGMWNWKPAKLVLESLWNSGEIVIAGRVSGFQRLLLVT